jgi:hypothetical protein
VVEIVKPVLFSLEEKLISTNHLKTLQKLMVLIRTKLMLSEELEMKLNYG